MSDGPMRIVIAGGGLAAWLAAAALGRVLEPTGYPITVVGTGDADDRLAPHGAADAMLPWPERQHAALDLDDAAVISSCAGTFSLGLALDGWNRPDGTYFHPFSQMGAALGPVSFYHIMLRLRQAGEPLRLSNFALAALAAQAGRFTRPDRDPASVLSTCRHGLHADCHQLAALYQAEAGKHGVAAVPGHLRRVELAADGSLAALVTSDEQRIEGDLFIDGSGVAARLISAVSGSDWVDWSGWLPCDSILSASFEHDEPPLPFSLASAHAAGWLRTLPLQGRLALVNAYKTDFADQEQALRQLQELASGRPLQNLQAHYVRYGRRGAPWQRNCVALGAAAALIDPVGISNLQLLRAGIDTLLQLLPGRVNIGATARAGIGAAAAAESVEYNRRFGALLDGARDFALAHYRLNGRRGEPLWDACREAVAPESLAYRMSLFESRGRVAMYDEEPFESDDWTNLFDEHGLSPRSYSPLADGYKLADLRGHVNMIRTVMLDAVARMPTHAQYLGRTA
jgi:tryptophan halogenase